MKIGNIKGALIECIVRNLLRSCGFTNVKADRLYTFERGGLFFINGKGAAHDADVLMDPPVQMPFAYPTRIIFECKAYDGKASLPTVRNALGLRSDINDFEIVTKESLEKRQNNRRASYAIETRQRFNYQVGVASMKGFRKPAVEFAANNRIPLLDLSWFLDPHTMHDIQSLSQSELDSLPLDFQSELYDLLKDKSKKLRNVVHRLQEDRSIRQTKYPGILDSVSAVLQRINVGLLETGDLLFLFRRDTGGPTIFSEEYRFSDLLGQIHYQDERPNFWTLSVRTGRNAEIGAEYDFYILDLILRYWKEFNLDRLAAFDIKARYFGRIFVFGSSLEDSIPFRLVSIDQEWLDSAREDAAPAG